MRWRDGLLIAALVFAAGCSSISGAENSADTATPAPIPSPEAADDQYRFEAVPGVRDGGRLDWDTLETPADAFDRMLPSPQDNFDDPLATEVSTDE